MTRADLPDPRALAESGPSGASPTLSIYRLQVLLAGPPEPGEEEQSGAGGSDLNRRPRAALPPGLEQHEAAAADAPGLGGQIDILACDVMVGRLWVLEDKEHIESASPYSITQRAGRFLKRKRQRRQDALAKARTSLPIQMPALRSPAADPSQRPRAVGRCFRS